MTAQKLQEIETSNLVSLAAQATELLADDIESNPTPCDHQIKLVDELRVAIKKHRTDIPLLIAALREAWKQIDEMRDEARHDGIEKDLLS